MPSDIERHRKSKQHLEVTITTVLKASEGRVCLQERNLVENLKSDHRQIQALVDHP